MLTKYFIEFIVYIVSQFLILLSSLFPEFNNLETLTTAVNSMLGVTTQIQNFAYFMLGDTYFIAILLIGPTLVFRYITVPILSFFRKLIVWGGN